MLRYRSVGLFEDSERHIGSHLNRIHVRLLVVLQLLALLIVVVFTVGCTRMGMPQGWSAGAVSGDMLYIGTMEGDLRALDIDTGDTMCTFKLENGNHAIYGTPAIAGETLFIGGYDGFLYGLPVDCREIAKWEPDFQRKVGNGEPVVPSPVVVGDTVLVGSSDGNLYAYNILRDEAGLILEEKWRFPTGDKVWSTPAVADGIAYFGSLDHNVYAVSLEDGTQVWRFPVGGAVTASPVVARGRVYLGAFDSIFYAIDAQTGEEVWRFAEAREWFWGGAVASEDTIYAPSLDGNLYALDMDTGELRWTLETDDALVGSPAIVGDMIAVTSLSDMARKVRLVRLNDAGGEQQCPIGNKAIKIRASLTANETADERVIFLAATDHSIRALVIKQNGNPDEKWVHFTNNEPPVPRDWDPSC